MEITINILRVMTTNNQLTSRLMLVIQCKVKSEQLLTNFPLIIKVLNQRRITIRQTVKGHTTNTIGFDSFQIAIGVSVDKLMLGRHFVIVSDGNEVFGDVSGDFAGAVCEVTVV